MKAILALTSLLAASAINLATIHDSHAATFVVFLHAADGADAAETMLSVESGLTIAACTAKASHVWEAAHVADIAALDAVCLPY